MKNTKYDFDKITERRGTNSLKFDGAVDRGMPENLLPMWVADMDFPSPPEVIDALAKRAKHGVFGYSKPDSEYYEVMSGYFVRRHGWHPEREWHLVAPGVVFALAAAVKAFTQAGDAVLIQPPVYYPFKSVLIDNGRRLINNPLFFDESAKSYRIDFDDFERNIVQNKVKLFILCSPHNPVGRVWTAAELSRVGEICLRHNTVIVSDEIHEDFVYTPHKHTVFLQACPQAAGITAVFTSPGKTFNLAGLQYADLFIPNKELRLKFLREYKSSGYSQLNVFGLTAAKAAYQFGEPWISALVEYLYGNALFIRDFLATQFPEIKYTVPEGTYLAWLDCRALGLKQSELDKRVIERAGLWFDGGAMFGAEGEGYERVNFACPLSVLKEAMERLLKIK